MSSWGQWCIWLSGLIKELINSDLILKTKVEISPHTPKMGIEARAQNPGLKSPEATYLFVFLAQMCPQSNSTQRAWHKGVSCGCRDNTVGNMTTGPHNQGRMHTDTPMRTQCEEQFLLWRNFLLYLPSLRYPQNSRCLCTCFQQRQQSTTLVHSTIN